MSQFVFPMRSPWRDSFLLPRLALFAIVLLHPSSFLLANPPAGDRPKQEVPPTAGLPPPLSAPINVLDDALPMPRRADADRSPSASERAGPFPSGPPLTPSDTVSPSPTPENLLPIDLPYALHRVNAANPTIALAQQRIAEAYAVLKQAEVLWVPNLWLGGNPRSLTFLPLFYRHQGFIQNAAGNVFYTEKYSVNLVAGASIDVSLADAFFAPRIGRSGLAAVQARAQAVQNDIQLEVALAYLDLLRAYGALAVNEEALRKAQEMLRAAEGAFRRGLGKTGADPNRARTEVEIRRQERLILQEQAAQASARLAQLLLIDPSADLLPADQTVLPITLVPTEGPIDELIATGLMNRPELAEDRALIEVALGRWREARVRPLIPTLQLFYAGGSISGGRDDISGVGGRNELLAQAGWELRNLGLGNLYESRERRAQYNESNLRLLETQARVAAEITAAAKIVRKREQAIREAQVAVRNAEETWRKLQAIAFGVGLPARQYDPLEPLLAERALLEARLLYLDHVITYNRSQFRLYWALGQPPEHALPHALVRPVEVSVVPSAAARTRLGSSATKDGAKEKGVDKTGP